MFFFIISAFADFMCRQLSISNQPQASNSSISTQERTTVEQDGANSDLGPESKQSQNCDGKDDSKTDIAQASSNDVEKTVKEVTQVRKCDPVQ